ncbi:aminoglycoside phosphotransferase [Protofrankia symbiont of Coriaria ruscifolia]|uniref:Aminoglycoside phosphotransferase n=1 Tax=Candidatus Protofrankia californiensis TaxID=1839754 RepID=A0A1C3NWC3_9ACTN|nr:aminoglycoside phosphotransferase [Protofrankia symbiont of Coriaria ruscifolia]SBW20786.1 aminoglycoside phosphotransferase [Candidatus Protofrankia californiensis]
MLDLRDTPVPDVIDHCSAALSVDLDIENPAFGWGGKSMGFQTDRGTWLKILFRPVGQLNERVWTGEECASVLTGVSKPQLLRSARWVDATRELVWRADETTRVESPAISATPEIREEPQNLSCEWWTTLRGSLTALAGTKTTRVAVRQDLIDRRIREYAGTEIDPTVDEWLPAHADVHWSNLTAPSMVLLDWEGWGLGPRGLDGATLWAFSLLVPAVAKRVVGLFSDDLFCRSGALARLFMCVELLRMTRNFSDHPDLAEPLTREADRLVIELSGTK